MIWTSIDAIFTIMWTLSSVPLESNLVSMDAFHWQCSGIRTKIMNSRNHLFTASLCCDFKLGHSKRTVLHWFQGHQSHHHFCHQHPGGSLRAGHRANWPAVNTTLPGCFTSQRTSFYYTERSKTVLSYNSALFLMSLIECKTYFAVQFPL